jgi:hypothetical protein
MAMKSAYLLNLLITTNNFPAFRLRQPLHKIILILINGALGMGSGCSNPGMRVFFDLFY